MQTTTTTIAKSVCEKAGSVGDTGSVFLLLGFFWEHPNLWIDKVPCKNVR